MHDIYKKTSKNNSVVLLHCQCLLAYPLLNANRRRQSPGVPNLRLPLGQQDPRPSQLNPSFVGESPVTVCHLNLQRTHTLHTVWI